MHLQSENHSDQVLAAVQSENGCDILLIGNDNVSSHSDNLWILSPLVRSIIDSLGNIRDNLIILPDFSYEDIKTGLEITEGNKGEVLRFNSSTKQLLETLGIDLRNVWSVRNNFENLDPSDESQDEDKKNDSISVVGEEIRQHDATVDELYIEVDETDVICDG